MFGVCGVAQGHRVHKGTGFSHACTFVLFGCMAPLLWPTAAYLQFMVPQCWPEAALCLCKALASLDVSQQPWTNSFCDIVSTAALTLQVTRVNVCRVFMLLLDTPAGHLNTPTHMLCCWCSGGLCAFVLLCACPFLYLHTWVGSVCCGAYDQYCDQKGTRDCCSCWACGAAAPLADGLATVY